MIYIIDGHNLIGKMPDIKLSDPDDEAKLVARLRDWIRLHNRRDVQVYFDAGEFGGIGNLNSISRLKVQFARVGRTADELIIKFLRALKNPQEYTLVTSDREIIHAARRRRVGYILSEEFAVMLSEALNPDEDALEEALAAEKEIEEAGAEAEPEVTENEVTDWIKIFDEAPAREPDDHIIPQPIFEKASKAAADKQKGPKQSGKPPLPPKDAKKLKAGEEDLSEEDLEAWLNLFGDKKPEKYQHDEPVVVENKEEVKRKAPPKKAPPRVRKYAEEKLTGDEVDAWLDLFQSGKKD